jgi:hypothetical protein
MVAKPISVCFNRGVIRVPVADNGETDAFMNPSEMAVTALYFGTPYSERLLHIFTRANGLHKFVQVLKESTDLRTL